MLKRLSVTFILFALIAGACSSDSVDEEAAKDSFDDAGIAIVAGESDTEATGEPESDIPEVPGAPLNRFDLEVGQCFNEGSWYDENLDRRVDLTASIDCAQAHQSEVYHEASFPAPNGAPFPGDDKMTEWSTQVCYDQFAPFVGADYEESSLEIGFVQPTRDTFEHPVGRHRRVFCYVHHISAEPIVGSAEGTGL